MKTLSHLFEKNKKWAEKIKNNDPDFFNSISFQQNPNYLWIGCSDSRVPANQIVDLGPGEMFVHRNIANQVRFDDLNCLSVIKFAVEVLNINHIIVCGHYNCGGVQAAIEGKELGLINSWLIDLDKLYKKVKSDLDKINEAQLKINKLSELNVIDQVRKICELETVKSYWQNKNKLSIHGWIFDIKTGLIKDLDVCISSNEEYISLFKDR